MRPRDVAFLGLGALVAPISYHLAMRFSGRHWLDITIKEKL